jgi:hypothetical protein
MYGPNTQLCSLSFDGVRISESPSPAVPFRCVNVGIMPVKEQVAVCEPLCCSAVLETSAHSL